MAWIPGNPHMAAVGATDSREDALTYLASLSNGMIDSSAAETFVDRGPEVVRWLEANTPVKFFVIAAFPTITRRTRARSPGAAGRWNARCSPSASSANGLAASPRDRSSPVR